jgi:hypothetical protein
MRRQLGDVDFIDEDTSGGSSVQSGDESEQRRLATAGGTEKHGKAALRDFEGHIIERAHISPVLRQVLDADRVHACVPCDSGCERRVAHQHVDQRGMNARRTDDDLSAVQECPITREGADDAAGFLD